MAGMLKLKEREFSNTNLKKFLKNVLDESDFTVDVLVHSQQGNCFYYCVPCSVIIESNFPNAETSHSLNIWWSKAEKRVGTPPKDGFPSYPACTEYKTYFNNMFFQQSYLEFRNIWHDSVAIYIFIHDNNVDNTDNMKEIAELWER